MVSRSSLSAYACLSLCSVTRFVFLVFCLFSSFAVHLSPPVPVFFLLSIPFLHFPVFVCGPCLLLQSLFPLSLPSLASPDAFCVSLCTVPLVCLSVCRLSPPSVCLPVFYVCICVCVCLSVFFSLPSYSGGQ